MLLMGSMDFQTKPLSENFGVEVLNVDLTQIHEDMAEAILSAAAAVEATDKLTTTWGKLKSDR